MFYLINLYVVELIGDSGNCKTHLKQSCSSLTSLCTKLNWTQLFRVIEDIFWKALPPPFEIAHWSGNQTSCGPWFSILATRHITSKPSEFFKSSCLTEKQIHTDYSDYPCLGNVVLGQRCPRENPAWGSFCLLSTCWWASGLTCWNPALFRRLPR